MNVNKITLSFINKDFETDFQNYHFSKSLNQLRVMLILVSVLIAVTTLLDYTRAYEHFEFFSMLRYYFMIPIILVSFVCSFFDFYKQIWQFFLVLSFIIASASISAMIAFLPDTYLYHLGLMEVFAAGYFLVSIRFIYASFAGILNIIVFNILMFSNTGHTLEDILWADFFFIQINLMSMFGAYFLEKYYRSNYYLKHKLEDHNFALEETVKERTEFLNESNRKYENLINSISDGIAIADSKQNFIFANPASERIFGVKDGELVGKNIYDFLDDDGKKLIDKLEIERKKGKGSDFKIRIIVDGRFKYLIINSKPYYDKNGKITGSQAIFKDVTEQTVAGRNLKESEDKLSLALKVANMGYWEYEAATNKVHWSKRHEKLFGISYDEFGGTLEAVQEIVHPADREMGERNLKNALLNKEPFINTYRVMHQNGEIRWLYSYGNVIIDENDNPTGIFGITQDITHYKLALINLKESEEKFRMIVEHSSELIYSIDLNGYFQYASPSWEKITGWKPEEVVGKLYKEIISEEYHVHLWEYFTNTIKNGNQGFVQYQIFYSDGSLHWHESTVSPVYDEEGNPEIIIGMCRDIEDRIKWEQELIQAKNIAEENNRLKTAFLQNMSHEIRTPLNGIIGYSSLLNNEGLSDDETSEFLNTIEKSSNRLLHLVDNILDISKIETGQMKKNIQQFQVYYLINEIGEMFLTEATAKNLKIETTGCNEEMFIYSDYRMIFSILQNIVENAIKFSTEGTITIGCQKEQSGILFFVRDFGAGIPKDKLEVIFDRFVQSETSLNRNYEGAGIGLSISKGLVDLLGGKIWAESELTKGSTFYVSIPDENKSE
jgi:PAS domain S-box-containing protein